MGFPTNWQTSLNAIIVYQITITGRKVVGKVSVSSQDDHRFLVDATKDS